MVSPCGRFAITFNGEIYNFASLRGGLEREGERFASSGDTEVLLRLWARDGLASVAKLRGMFAFGVWDRSEQRLTLVRDPLGIKPLYYAHAGDRLAFASEIGALRKAGFAGELDPAGVGAFLRWGSVPAPLTVFKDIRAVPPGSAVSMLIGTDVLERRRFWDMGAAWETSRVTTAGIADQASAVEWARAALTESVRAHLVSDVPVGAFLSGGIDSAAVVALMRRAGAENIHTFSIGSGDSALDETAEARETAHHYQTTHHETILGKHDFRRMIPDFVESLDQPTIDGFNTYVVSELAHAQGMKVVVSGVGGDELFRGYGRQFRRLPAAARGLAIVPRAARHLGAAGVRAVTTAFPHHRARRAGELLGIEPDLRSVYLWSRQLFTPAEVRALCADPAFGEAAARTDLAHLVSAPLPAGAGAEAELSALETTRYLEPQLLRDSDRFSMAHSLELRTPLVDRVLYEQLLALPARYFAGPGSSAKPLLVAGAGLPPELAGRKKRGFALPFQAWLGDYPPPAVASVLNVAAASSIHEQVRRGHRRWAASWALLILGSYLERETGQGQASGR